MVVIPLRGGLSNSKQQFSVNLGNFEVGFSLRYLGRCDPAVWSCDLDLDGVRVASGVILAGNSDLLANYQGLGAGHLVLVGADPTLENLGTENYLVWVSPDE